jgi:hypothetical protein
MALTCGCLLHGVVACKVGRRAVPVVYGVLDSAVLMLPLRCVLRAVWCCLQEGL